MTYGELLRRYRQKHQRLVEPRQGFHSLDDSLHLAYSMGRKRGFTDLGTYANKPGDHGYYPAQAFDLGRKDRFFNRGFRYLKARRLCNFYWKHRKALNIEYIILGKKVISRSRPHWHPLTTGDTSHMWHVHVSGHHDK